MFKLFEQDSPSESHEHDWQPIVKTIVEPKNVTVPQDPTLTRLALTGQTTYLFQCTVCKDFRKEQCEGVEERALDRLLDKVDVGGPEFILRDNKTYVIMRKPDDPNILPVRSAGHQ